MNTLDKPEFNMLLSTGSRLTFAAAIALLINAFCPVWAAAQIRSAAWLSIGGNSESAWFADINNVLRIGSDIRITSLIIDRARQERAATTQFSVAVWEMGCTQAQGRMVSISTFDAAGQQIDSWQPEGQSQPILPGSITAVLYNLGCFPSSAEVSPSSEEARLELNRRRGLDKDDRPIFPTGVVVAVRGRGFALATPRNYEPLNAERPLTPTMDIPIGLFTAVGEDYLYYNGTDWVSAGQTVPSPQFRSGATAIGPDSTQYTYFLGWRPVIWPADREFTNGDVAFFDSKISTYWAGQFWYGGISEDLLLLIQLHVRS